jgi:hypothetical protein
MTLCDMRANRVRSLNVCCWLCHHGAILSADPWPDYVPVGRSIRAWCATWCDIIGAHGVVRTAHREKAFALRRGIGGQ